MTTKAELERRVELLEAQLAQQQQRPYGPFYGHDTATVMKEIVSKENEE